MTMWPWGLQLGRNTPSETAQAAYKGQLYQRRSDGIYLKDFGRGDSDDSAKLYSGQMLDFDGVDDYVDVEDFSITVSAFTITATIKNISTSEEDGIVYFPSRIVFSVFSGSPSKIRFYDYNDKSEQYHDYYHDIDDFIRIVITVDYLSNYIKIYTDGILGYENESVEFYNTSATLEYPDIGKFFSNHYFNGLIGNVQIWNAPFDADDVTYDFNNCFLGDITAANRPGTSLSLSNLKGWWKLIEGSGSTAYDWSGNGNHGTLVNFPTDDSQWVNAEQLSDPIAIQTALMEWGMGSNVLTSAQDLDTWDTVDGATKTASTANSPEGNSHMVYKCTPDGSNKFGRLRKSLTGIPAGEYQFKIWAKPLVDGQLFKLYVYGTNSGIMGATEITGVGTGWQKLRTSGVATFDGSETVYLFAIPDFNAGIYSADFWCPQLTQYSGEEASVKPSSATNALVPTRTWETAGQFLRTHGELNWNGRSYADCGNGVDVNPSTALIIEMVAAPTLPDGLNYEFFTGKMLCFYVYGNVVGAPNRYNIIVYYNEGNNNIIDYVSASAGTRAHLVFTYDSTSKKLHSFLNGVEIAGSPVSAASVTDYTINTSAYNLFLGDRKEGDYPQKGQLPLFKMYINEKAQAIIDGDLDAWVEKQYLKAKAKYDL